MSFVERGATDILLGILVWVMRVCQITLLDNRLQLSIYERSTFMFGVKWYLQTSGVNGHRPGIDSSGSNVCANARSTLYCPIEQVSAKTYQYWQDTANLPIGPIVLDERTQVRLVWSLDSRFVIRECSQFRDKATEVTKKQA